MSTASSVISLSIIQTLVCTYAGWHCLDDGRQICCIKYGSGMAITSFYHKEYSGIRDAFTL